MDGDIAKLKKLNRDQEFFDELDDLEKRHEFQTRKRDESTTKHINLSIPGPAGGILDAERKNSNRNTEASRFAPMEMKDFEKKPWKSITEDLDHVLTIHKIKHNPQVKKNKE